MASDVDTIESTVMEERETGAGRRRWPWWLFALLLLAVFGGGLALFAAQFLAWLF